MCAVLYQNEGVNWRGGGNGGGRDKKSLFVSACFGVRIVGDTVFFSLNIQSTVGYDDEG